MHTLSDSRNRARTEARLLDRLGSTGVTPRFLGIFTAQGDMFVAEQRIEGMPLRRFVARHVRPTATGGLAMDTALVLDLATQLVELLAEVHAAGYVFGDLTPNNVMVTERNRLVLIDLESALRPWEVTVRIATRGYTAPEEESRARLIAPAPDITTDLYSLGATQVYLASGMHPPMYPGSRFPAMVELMAARNPAIATLRPLLTALVDDDPEARPALPAVRAALREPRPAALNAPAQPDADELIEDMLAQLVHTMTPESSTPESSTPESSTPESSTLWPTSPVGRAYDPCAMHVGAAGVLAVLNQALRAGRGNGVAATADVAAKWIVQRLADEPTVLPGLLFGRAGTALTLVEAGALLEGRDVGAAGVEAGPAAADQLAGSRRGPRRGRRRHRASLAGGPPGTRNSSTGPAAAPTGC